MADQQKLQISELQFDTFHTLSTFSCWKIRFKTQVCACSGSPSKAMLWIKEVEMVDSVNDLNYRTQFKGILISSNFEILDAKMASALKRIITKKYFRRRTNVEEQEAHQFNRFLRGRQIAYMIYDYFRVTGANDSVENYADLFTLGLRNDDIQEFDSKCVQDEDTRVCSASDRFCNE